MGDIANPEMNLFEIIMKLTGTDAETLKKRFLADEQVHRRSSNTETSHEGSGHAASTSLPNDQSLSVPGTSNLTSVSMALNAQPVDPRTDVYGPQIVESTPLGLDASTTCSTSKKPETPGPFTTGTQSGSHLQDVIRQTIRDTIREELRLGPSGVSKVDSRSTNGHGDDHGDEQ